MLGGAIMHTLGAQDTARTERIIESVPLIDRGLIVTIQTDINARGTSAMIEGGFTGKPYKIYAAELGASGTPMPRFLLATIAARAPRFIFTTAIALLFARTVLRDAPMRTRLIAHAGIWLAIYAVYYVIRTR